MPTNGAILTSVTFKGRSNQKLLVLCHVSLLDRCTYDNNLELIQPLRQELQHFLCFWFWPPGGQSKNPTELKFGLSYSYLVVRMYKVSGHI
jgi:hypothetical protein